MLKSWGDEGERKNQAVGDVIAEHCLQNWLEQDTEP